MFQLKRKNPKRTICIPHLPKIQCIYQSCALSAEYECIDTSDNYTVRDTLLNHLLLLHKCPIDIDVYILTNLYNS